MPELVLKHDRMRLPLRLTSFYELYKRFLKEHGCKWHDVSKLLNVVAEILFDVDDACTKSTGKFATITWHRRPYSAALVIFLKSYRAYCLIPEQSIASAMFEFTLQV
ncbi:unnamed protein product [Pieris macdunnoughi]|uniref:Uncharacterized protein n=1 Tax=Pieris macdunnoughi TaxID=345717 RepID=A0A821QE25_9NEOP|nr:unnamed protein product [Pieris macdunnoughi]